MVQLSLLLALLEKTMKCQANCVFLAAGVAVTLFFSGCDSRSSADRQSASSANSKETVSPVKTPDSPIAVRIDGRDVTRQDIIRNARMMLTLNLNKRRKTKIGRAEQAYLRSYYKRAVPLSIGRAAVAAYLKERGVSVSSNDLERVSRGFTRKYGVYSRKLKRWHTINDLKYMLGKLAPCLDDEIFANAQYDLATNEIIRSAHIEVTDLMVSERLGVISNYNRRASSTNVLVFARATNVWQQVVAKKLTFEEAAEKFSEDAYLSSGIEWGSFSRDQLSDEPAVLAILPTLKVGDVTPPVESDGGLAVLRRDENDNPDVVSFSRIFFRLPKFYEEETADDVRAALEGELKGKVVKDALDGVAARLKVEYPDGTNVMARAVTSKEFDN